MARTTAGHPVKTAKARVTSHAALNGWTVRDDGGPGKVTDYFLHKEVGFRFVRVYYDRFGRIVSVRDSQGRRLVTGGQRERKVLEILSAK